MDVLRQQRLVHAFFIFWLCFMGLVAHLWLIQVRDGERYAVLALEQGSRWVSLEDVPRGKILDRHLSPVTGERIEERVVLFPMAVSDRSEVALHLAKILGVDESLIKKYLSGSACCLPYRITPEQSAVIRGKGWAGVMVLPVRFRYGERQLAAQVVGHLGKISSYDEFLFLAGQGKKIYHYGDLVGKTGLEKYYEQDLKGLRPQTAVRVYADAGGRLLGGPGFELEKEVKDQGRRDLVLTIDVRLQEAVEDIMDRRVTKGAVVVMEPGTGDILAMASRPGFDPANLEQASGAGGEERFFDHCTALYQPGSVFKVVLAAAALEEGVVDLGSRFTCHGEKENLIRCWKDSGHGEIDFSHAFAESCNPTFARIGLELGAEKLVEYAKRFGMENQSVIGYPVQSDPRQDLNLIGDPYNLVNSSVGQGPVLVTPVQIAAMMNTVISGGVYREPRLVREVRKNGGGVIREFAVDPGNQAISPETAGKMRNLLQLVTDDGTGREAQVPVWGSAGKSGSAQVGSSKDYVNAWFCGYAPRANPRYIVTVLVEGGVSGGQSAAPVFREVMERILQISNGDGLTK